MYDFKAIYRPSTVAEAIQLLAEHAGSLVLAGGSDILIKIREGRLAGAELVSIYELDCLRGISLAEDGSIRILPLTSFSHVERNPIIQAHIPVLASAVGMVGGPQIRNIGTIGGNICNGVTSADSASTLKALDAELEITGPNGLRRISIHDFYQGPGKVALAPAELLTCIVIPKESYENCFGAYLKYAMRSAMDIATLGCSVNVRLAEDLRHISRLRIAYGVASATPMRCLETEQAACGALVQPALIEQLQTGIEREIMPRTSWRASKEFRTHIARELVKRAFVASVQAAGGEL